MRKIFAALALMALASFHPLSHASAQGVTRVCVTTNAVGGCQDVSSAHPFPISGSFSATIAGFSPASVGTPISATTGGATGTLPAGTTVVATNVGTTNAAYCALGGSSSTSQQYIAPNGGWFAFTVGVATQLTCVTSTSTTTINMVGGSGLATGTGGGLGGSGTGGNVTVIGPLGTQAIAASVAVTPATSSIWPVSQSGTWTVQPGNTPNTTAWLVTGTGGTFPATQSGTWTVQPGNTANTVPWLVNDATVVAAINAAAVTPTSLGVGATGSAVPGSAQYQGGQARSTEATAASTGNLTGQTLDLSGKTVTSPYAIRESMVRGTATATGTGATTLIAAAGASVKNYVTDVECGRDDAGTTAIHVTFSDANSTVLVVPNSGGGGGHDKTFQVPLVTAANTAFTFTSSNSITTVYCSAQGFTGY